MDTLPSWSGMSSTKVETVHLVRSAAFVPRVYSTVSGVARSIVIYILLQSVTSYPQSRPSSRCLSRCLLLGAQRAYYDVTTCEAICGRRERGQSDLGVRERRTSLGSPPRTISPMGRILELFDQMDREGAAPECDHRGEWDLRYEKKTEYKQLTLPAVQMQKRRWGSTIGPCISAHCSGVSGPSRTACIVKMCNRKRRSRFR